MKSDLKQTHNIQIVSYSLQIFDLISMKKT